MPTNTIRVNIDLMKWDVLIIRVAFVLLLAAVGYFLNPVSQTSHIDAARPTRQIISAIVGAVIALLIVIALL